MNEWIDVKERTPDLINGKDYSKNVLAIVKGYTRIQVMCYGWSNGYGEPETVGYFWANCNEELYGDGEWDDDYIVTHWMPLPEPPQPTLSGTTPSSLNIGVINTDPEGEK